MKEIEYELEGFHNGGHDNLSWKESLKVLKDDDAVNFSVKVELVAPPVNVPTTNAPAAELVDSLIALKTTLGLEVPEPPNVLAPVPAPLHN